MSSLAVRVSGNQALLMRGGMQIGSFQLDHHLQIQGVTIAAVASVVEAELIIRLASSHVAQYIVTGRVARESVGFFLQANTRIPPLPGLTKDDSRRLLDFKAIAPQQSDMSVQDLRSVLESLGVRVTQQQ